NDLYTALDILKQSIYEWIENNTDEQDKLMNLERNINHTFGRSHIN
ncbi:DUF1108 family protein, partial [Staphylococcus aureus]